MLSTCRCSTVAEQAASRHGGGAEDKAASGRCDVYVRERERNGAPIQPPTTDPAQVARGASNTQIIRSAAAREIMSKSIDN